ncbi:hypothetical protein [Labrys wisconsinensis]|uniref:Uncharacterized protein n=1 Tax=Labrys wisconsinensis TaxID=425677 RepID=A0ABU0JB47_9HYPH|nr:hypothetical protein [Labrys wisconsinensis]MDQ0471505.1 hypothetical protein [Labrys wisconsinensis]
MTRHAELTLDDLLTDPVTLALMRADKIDPVALRGMLERIGRRLASEGGPARSPGAPAAWKGGADVLRDCIHFAEARRMAGTHRPW